MTVGAAELGLLAPVLVLVATGLLVIVADWLMPKGEIRVPAVLSLLGLVGAAWLLVSRWPSDGTLAITRDVVGPDGTSHTLALVAHDVLGAYASVVVVLAAAAAVVIGLDSLGRRAMARAEYFALVMFAAAGMMLVAMANDLIVLFLCVEAFSLALYVLAAFGQPDRKSLEAAFKYFVMGAVAAGFFLYGIALLYAATGTTDLRVIGEALTSVEGSVSPVVFLGMAMLMVGLGFKLSIVPFHQWTPDVYEGSPTPTAAFMASATKAAVFAALVRVLWVAFPALSESWQLALAVLAVVTMVVGNLAALMQGNLKRMLGYSTIAHVGYIMVAVIVGTDLGYAAALFYLLMYAVMILGTFSALVVLDVRASADHEPVEVADLTGLSGRHPLIAAALALFFLGLAGFPPTAGFLAKWYVFRATVDAGQTLLAVAVVLNSVLAAFYYLRPVLYMYMVEPDAEPNTDVDAAPTARWSLAAGPSAVVVALAALVTSLALIVSTPLIEGALSAAPATEAPETSDGSSGGTLFMTIPSPWEGE